MFIPTGVPEEANANISSDVKSGLFFFFIIDYLVINMIYTF